jgi:hypothetical protein
MVVGNDDPRPLVAVHRLLPPDNVPSDQIVRGLLKHDEFGMLRERLCLKLKLLAAILLPGSYPHNASNFMDS